MKPSKKYQAICHSFEDLYTAQLPLAQARLLRLQQKKELLTLKMRRMKRALPQPRTELLQKSTKDDLKYGTKDRSKDPTFPPKEIVYIHREEAESKKRANGRKRQAMRDPFEDLSAAKLALDQVELIKVHTEIEMMAMKEDIEEWERQKQLMELERQNQALPKDTTTDAPPPGVDPDLYWDCRKFVEEHPHWSKEDILSVLPAFTEVIDAVKKR